MNKEKQLTHVEILRGISILFVFLFHLNIPAFKNGFLGVDIFFVISGFLMAKVYGQISTFAEVKTYLTKRLSRLLPAYFVVLFATLFLSIFIVLPHELSIIGKHGIWSAFLAPNIGFWMETSYFDSSLLKPLLNFWSLGVEVQFYLLFPLIVWCFRKGIIFVFFITIISLAVFWSMNSISPTTAFFLMPARIWEFMIGFFVAKVPFSEKNFTKFLGVLSLSAVLFFILFFPDIHKNTAIATIVTVILTAIVIYSRLPMLIEQINILSTLGKYSYSIYLVHFPVIVLTNYMPFRGTLLSPPSNFSLLIIIILTLILSFGLYHLIENPLRRRLTSSQVFGGAFSFAFLSVLATLLLNNSAQAFVPENKYKISAAFLDRDVYRCGKIKRLADPFSESCLLTEKESVAKRFLLVGNSHADALKLRLAETIQSKNGSLRLMKQNYSLGKGYPPSVVLAEAKKQDINVIIIHSSSRLIDYEAIRELVKMAAASGIKVVSIDPIPTFQYHVPEKLYNALNSKEAASDSGLTIEDYNEKYKDLAKSFDELEGAHSNFKHYQVANLLCTPKCQIIHVDGKPLYFDSSHLTLTGSGRLNKIFESIASD